MKIYDDAVEVRSDVAELYVRADGKATLSVRSDGLPVMYEWAGQGWFDWENFRVHDTPAISWDEWESEAAYEALESAIEEWARTEDGKEWMKANKIKTHR